MRRVVDSHEDNVAWKLGLAFGAGVTAAKSPDQDAIALPRNPASRTQSSSRAEKLWCHSGEIHGHRCPRDR